MKTLTKWMLAALATTAVVGCDPFEEAVGGPPAVIGAGFTDTTAGNCPNGDCIAYTGTGSGSTWTVPGVKSICSSAVDGQSSVSGFIFVKFNKLLDGGSIQVSPNPTSPTIDCTPAAALNLVVTINGSATPPAGETWYACYDPQAPAPTEGASVIIFLGPTATPPSGWSDALPVPASGTATTTVHATGTAHDKDGTAAPFDVTVSILPDPAPGTPAFSNFLPTSLTLDWTPACVAVNNYDLQRAPDVAGAAGPYVTITTTTATTFGDTGLTTGNSYWYRVVANVTTPPPVTATSGEAKTSTAPAVPAAPTLTAGAAGSGSVTVTWTAVTGATSYRVQRSLDNVTFVNVATNLTTLTFTNTGLASGTTYYYRIVAVNARAVITATGAAATSTGASASVIAP